MEKKDYVSYDVAMSLKEKGFDEGCFYQYKIGEKDSLQPIDMECVNTYRMCYNSEIYKDVITAPTLYDAQKWLKEKHNIYIAVGMSGDYVTDADGNIVGSWDFWCYDIYYTTNFSHHLVDCEGEFESYEAALNDGIKRALRYI